MEEGTVRVGVAGTGHLGSLHAGLLAKLEGVALSGVYDVNGESAVRAASASGTTAFATLDALIDASDALIVATSTKAHCEIASAALRKRKHVLVEKPITATIEEARTLNNLATTQGRILQVGHIERFNPAVLALEPFLLRPLFVESHRLAQFNPRGTDVAVVLDLMIHDIDLILSLVQSPVARIDANGVAVVSESPDIANARIQFENGCVANVTASRISQAKMRKMRLFQHDAYISIDFAQPLAEVFRLVDEGAKDVQPTMMLGKIDQGSRKRMIIYERPEIQERNALREELASFVNAVRTGVRPVVSGEDGQQALEVATEIMSKIESRTAHG